MERHGGNLEATARRLGCRPDQLLDASASLVPFTPAAALRRALRSAPLRAYPDRTYTSLREAMARLHGLDPAQVLPGNGAAELFTWVAREAAAAGVSLLPAPGFADYERALGCWGGAWRHLPLTLDWPAVWPLPFPDPGLAQVPAQVLWITNPHNPTGQLWSRASLEPLLDRLALVIVDEAFLPLVPGGEAESLIPLVAEYPNLVVIRSLTKLFAMAGLRLGYAVAAPERLRRWSGWRDPWPVNALAAAAGEALLTDGHWPRRVRRWVGSEGPWLHQRLAALPGLHPLPSAANFLLVRGERSLVPLRERLEDQHRVLLRDGRSFTGLGPEWLRIGLQDRPGNQRILRALAWELRALA
ncbi:aminotransferase class I/II-fold pyridoxal phosphate-dependent enzyme [Cyanobium sp. Morenito 9A2]|nr:aminotransferase class I/II-fold pyridoxal phosphate-dependent enzyme [Cyanobium sp. Morenito 9A2]